MKRVRHRLSGLLQAILPFERTDTIPAPPAERLDPTSALPSFFLVRHPRARRYVIRVRPDRTVRVTIPRWGSKREALAFAERQRSWIEGQLRRLEAERAEAREVMAPDALRALRGRAVGELPRRLEELATSLGLKVSRISVRNQKW